MISGGSGGGGTVSGAVFEQATDIGAFLSSRGFSCSSGVWDVWSDGVSSWVDVSKGGLGRWFKAGGVSLLSVWSKVLRPDVALLNVASGQLVVVEKKFQATAGSVDEKLETFPFKLWKYERLIGLCGVRSVKFVFLGNDWFEHPRYFDVVGWLRQNRVEVCFGVLPHSLLDVE